MGGSGADTLKGGPGDDILDGGSGNDTVNYSDALSGVTVSLAVTARQNTGGGGQDKLDSIENLTGSAFNDVLTGDDGANSINGGKGDDILVGGAGTDDLSGGAGLDIFRFLALSDSTKAGPDLIGDFTAGDKIDLSAIDADTATAGKQDFHLGGGGKHAGDIVVTFDAGNDRTVIDLYVDKNKSVDGRILLSGDHSGLTGGDFIFTAAAVSPAPGDDALVDALAQVHADLARAWLAAAHPGWDGHTLMV
jgi:Ca2+-binding RTX toxin-like protein